ncbi:MAG: UDP-N-acetylmuramoyl-L-alanyl-D-glutamate--2,6-diaminopimelate ligase [Colwellia sp.]
MMHNYQKDIMAVLNYFEIDLAHALDEHSKMLKVKSLVDSTKELTNDTRAIKIGDIFCAVIGTVQDGREYIQQAVNNGAYLVISECEAKEEHGNVTFVSQSDVQSNVKSIKPDSVIVVSFYQLNSLLFNLSKLYYGNPQSKMSMVGITGTNGKTSTSQLLGRMLSEFNTPCPIIGTNGYGFVESLTPLNNTTPSASQLHQILFSFVEGGAKCVAMEASSHALEQGRVYSELFDIALFTNLSRDHLDYHQTMTDYAKAKKRIFTGDSSQIAVLNGDDEQAKIWLASWPAQQVVWVFGKEKEVLDNSYYVQASNISHHDHGVDFCLKTHLGKVDIESPLLGDFNVDNLLGVIAVLMIQGISIESIALKLKGINPIAGRMESTSLDGYPTTVVDYAHTPDALEKALLACKQHCHGKLWVVFGCGGDRDKGKRPLMAQAAEKIADNIVLTNDNPRTESPQAIVDDMLEGIKDKNATTIRVVLDREEAVLSTIKMAKHNDIILLAGKGHENYILMNNETIAYDERAIVASYYKAMKATLNKVSK